MLALLEDILRSVGSMLLEWRAAGVIGGHWVGSQFKAEADQRAHDFLAKQLRLRFPGATIVSEEGGNDISLDPSKPYWLVDPIDGTASYVQGFSGFVTQAAWMVGGRPQASAVYAPALDLLYVAERGGGAHRLGSPIPPASGDRPMKTLIDNYPDPRGIARAAFDALGLKRYVESGSIGLKICRIADATADLFLKDVVVRDWDLAAPHLVLEEAGGTLSNIRGYPVTYSGSGRHEGVIATRSPMSTQRVAQWYTSNLAQEFKS